MAWYSTGTLTLVNGSTTVVGVGTDFISGANVGEALYLNDNLYEIGAIVSATQLTLVAPYLGSTDTGVTYKIIPTQSLVADLAAGVSDLITDYSDVKDTAGEGKFNDGTVTAPGITFEGDQNTGIYKIDADNFGLTAGGTKQIDISTTDVELNYSGSKKLATTSTGVDVTGTVTADSLTVEGSSSGTLNSVNFLNTNNGATATANRLGLGISNSAGSNYTYIEAKELGVDAFAEMNFYTGVSPTKRMTLGTYGDVSFYEDTGTTAKFHWDSSAESLGIGGAPTNKLSVTGSDDTNGTKISANVQSTTVSATNNASFSLYEIGTEYGRFQRARDGAGTVKLTALGTQHLSLETLGAGSMYFKTNDTERMRIDTDGYIGIGESDPSGALDIGGQCILNDNYDGIGATFRRNGTYGSVVALGRKGVSDGVTLDYPTGNTLGISTGGSERARIDSSGNLLVGKSSADVNTVGHQFLSDASGDYAAHTSNGTRALLLNRKGTDGEIVSFRKDSSTVGGIGAEGGDLVIGTGSTAGLQFNDATPTIRPWNMSANTRTDGVCDLGYSNSRFKDLYLSGGVYLGGTGSANKLDDYEEGTWTPTVDGDSTGVIELTTAYYTKVGNIVTLIFAIDVSTEFSNNRIGGIPFAASHPSMSSTWGPASIMLNDTSTENISCAIQLSLPNSIQVLEDGRAGNKHFLGSGANRYYRASLTYRTNA